MKCILLFFLLITFGVFSQKVDYFKLSDTLGLDLSDKSDSNQTLLFIAILEKLDTNIISKNIEHYYYDLGMEYYCLAAFRTNSAYLQKSIQYNLKAISHKQDFSDAYSNISVCYYFLHDCSNATKYIEEYKKHTPKKKWDNKIIKSIEECMESQKTKQ